MADENNKDNPEQEDESWKEELTPEARSKIRVKSEVKDIHKMSNGDYFEMLRQDISNSKKLQGKLKKAASVLRQKIQDTRRKIKEFIRAIIESRPYQATIIAVKHAKHVVNFLKFGKNMAANDMKNMENIEASGTRASYRTLVGVRYREPEKFNIEVKVMEKTKAKKNKKEAEQKAAAPEKQASLNQQAAAVPGVKTVKKPAAKSKAEPENAKLKEVARGVSAQSEIMAEQSQKSAVKTDKAEKSAAIGLSKRAEKQLRKEERRQEKKYKQLEQEKDKGITAERTISDKERTEADKTKAEKMPEHQNKETEAKRKADELRQAILTKKIDYLRDKLEQLQKKREEQTAAAGPRNKENTIKMTPKEAEALPSVQAEKAIQKAEMSTEIPEVEKSGAVSEESLQRMEKSAEKAESGLKQAMLVPDYATPEFKQKAAELNKSQQEQKQADLQKVYALSGRPGAETEKEPAENGMQNQNEAENQSDKPQLRIDPEKSKAMSAERQSNSKTIDMRAYQYMHGGKSVG